MNRFNSFTPEEREAIRKGLYYADSEALATALISEIDLAASGQVDRTTYARTLSEEFGTLTAERIRRVASDIILIVKRGVPKQEALAYQMGRITLTPATWEAVRIETDRILSGL